MTIFKIVKNGVFWVVTPCGTCKNPEDTILHSHRRENLKSYIFKIVYFLESNVLPYNS
jgi:hypothetical protein